MARSFPLLPPPQKNRAPRSDLSPETPVPGGSSRSSSTSPVLGSMRRISLASSCQVPRQSSLSTLVTPVTKRSDSTVRSTAPVSGRSNGSCDHGTADPERPFSPGKPRIPAISWGRYRAEHLAGTGIDLPDPGFGDLKQMLSVEGRSRIRGDIERADQFPGFRIEGV
jgi:hypothetical protein